MGMDTFRQAVQKKIDEQNQAERTMKADKAAVLKSYDLLLKSVEKFISEEEDGNIHSKRDLQTKSSHMEFDLPFLRIQIGSRELKLSPPDRFDSRSICEARLADEKSNSHGVTFIYDFASDVWNVNIENASKGALSRDTLADAMAHVWFAKSL